MNSSGVIEARAARRNADLGDRAHDAVRGWSDRDPIQGSGVVLHDVALGFLAPRREHSEAMLDVGRILTRRMRKVGLEHEVLGAQEIQETRRTDCLEPET